MWICQLGQTDLSSHSHNCTKTCFLEGFQTLNPSKKDRFTYNYENANSNQFLTAAQAATQPWATPPFWITSFYREEGVGEGERDNGVWFSHFPYLVLPPVNSCSILLFLNANFYTMLPVFPTYPDSSHTGNQSRFTRSLFLPPAEFSLPSLPWVPAPASTPSATA